jgi:hypothetical protein
MKAVASFAFALMVLSPSGGAVAAAGPQDEDMGQMVEFREGSVPRPLRPLPFALNLGPDRPRTLGEAVEEIFEALPRRHRVRIADYYEHGSHRGTMADYRTREASYDRLYIPEIVAAAFRAWGYAGDNGPLSSRISCVGSQFQRQVALQLGILSIYDRQPTPVRYRGDLAYLAVEADSASRRLFDLCDLAGRPGSSLPH